MAMVTMTMDEIKKVMTPERIARETEAIRNHIDVYDPDCPPCSGEKLARFKPVNTREKKA